MYSMLIFPQHRRSRGRQSGLSEILAFLGGISVLTLKGRDLGEGEGNV